MRKFIVSGNYMSRLLYIAFIVFLTSPVLLNAQQVQTAMIGGKRYTGHLDQFGFFLLTQKGDTILSLPQESYFEYKFKDFNQDGYKDIYLDWGGNSVDKYSLYVFVPATKKFKEIKNFSDFPAATQIKGTNYYYSYSKAGCADNTWISDLFYIKNWTAINIGYINGEGCGIKDGIYIYNVKAGKKKLIKTMPLNTIEKYKEKKWGFIQDYWTKNFQSFL
jgi:hypothetical protein